MPQINNTISSFLSGFRGGNRPNRFEITTSGCKYNESNSLTDLDTKYHIRAASIPGSTVTPININWFGRTVPIPGERVYDEWTITILDDTASPSQSEPSALYKKFKDWQNKIVNLGTDIKVSTKDISTCKWIIKHYSSPDQTKLKTFNLYQVWPVYVGNFILDMSQDNVLATFDVRLAFTHFDYTYV
jgi:hypothetical protein